MLLVYLSGHSFSQYVQNYIMLVTTFESASTLNATPTDANAPVNVQNPKQSIFYISKLFKSIY